MAPLHLFPNFWRGIVLMQCLIVFGLTSVILVRYAMRKDKSRDRVVSWHILCISTSYLGLTAFVGLEMANRWGFQLSYRIPLAIISFVLGDFALVFMLIHLVVQRQLIGKIRERVMRSQAASTSG